MYQFFLTAPVYVFLGCPFGEPVLRPQKYTELFCTDMIQVLIGPGTQLGPLAQLGPGPIWASGQLGRGPIWVHWPNLMCRYFDAMFPLVSAMCRYFDVIFRYISIVLTLFPILQLFAVMLMPFFLH